jgi:hypothetical protein
MDDVSMGDDSDVIALSPSSQQQQPQKKTTTKKCVRFSNLIEMRNYNVVLSDHPLCDDGLAIELGWTYDPALTELVDLDTHEEYKSIVESAHQQQQSRRGSGGGPSWSGRSSGLMGSTVQRRTTFEKQQLLQDVGGYSVMELQASITKAIAKKHASIVGRPLSQIKSCSDGNSNNNSKTVIDLVSMASSADV